MNNSKYKLMQLKKYIDECNHIVIFSGAGMSTESGIKDFRSKDGLYNEKYKYPVEDMLSHNFFINHTDEFFKFYKDKLNCLEAKPNYAHKYFYELEKNNKLEAIITQNIDNLHTKAGNKKVIELHGNINRNYCMKCHKFYDGSFVFNSNGTCLCECGSIIKPDVVLYEEALDENNIVNAINAIRKADLLIIVGTSLSVYPASGFVNYFNGKYLVIINNSPTYMDNKADLVINDTIVNVFKKINE